MTKADEIEMLKRQNADLWYKLDKAYAEIERLRDKLELSEYSKRFYKKELDYEKGNNFKRTYMSTKTGAIIDD